MHRLGRFLDAARCGSARRPSPSRTCDDIVAPVRAVAGIGLDERRAAAGAERRPGCGCAARRRPAPDARWTISIGRSSATPGATSSTNPSAKNAALSAANGCVAAGIAVDAGLHQIRPLGDRRARRAEPDAGRAVRAVDNSAAKRPSTSTRRRGVRPAPSAQAARAATPHRRRRCTGRQQRLLFQRLQIEIAPALAAPARETELGKAGEALPARAARASPARPRRAAKRVEIGPRLGLDREIDDRAHRSRCLTPRRRRRRSRGAPARRRGSCRPTATMRPSCSTCTRSGST